MIEIKQLSKQYKKNEWALNELNLTIENGMFGLLGPNGAGKTTLIRILATLLKPTSGEVIMNGRSLRQADEIRKQIGYLPQFFQIYPQISGYDFLDYVGVMKGIQDKKRRRSEIEVLLEKLNLTAKGSKKVGTYSGGMKQRLGIAQALLGEPEILIVDEPTTGLDPEERVRFRNLLAQYSRDRIVILSTHIVSDIESSCRQLAVLNKGEIALSGDLTDVQSYAEGKVWEMNVSEHSLGTLDAMQVVSTRRNEGGYITCKVIAEDQPSSDAISLTPTLEDGYLALIGGERNG